MVVKNKKSSLGSVFKGGLSEKNIKARQSSGRNPNGIILKESDPVAVQFYTEPDDPSGFLEYEQHVWSEGAKKWFFVPCMGEKECILCDDEDENKSKASYAFAAQVYDFKDKKPKVLTQGVSLANQILFKWKRKTQLFRRRVWEITRLPTKPTTWSVDQGEESAIKLTDKAPINLEEYLKAEYQRYIDSIGGAKRSRKGSSLEDDDLDDDEPLDDEDELEDDEDDDEEDFEDDEEEDDLPPVPSDAKMQKMEWSKLKQLARDRGADTNTRNRSELIANIHETE